MNPVFAVDFMKPHHDGEHDHPKFDRKVLRSLLFLGAAAVLAYMINKGLGNFVVFAAVLYLLNHFFLLRVIDRFQKNAWPRFQSWYARRLEKAVQSPWWVLFSIFVLFIFTMVFVAARSPKVEFFPAADPNFTYVYVTLPTGTDQAYTNQVIGKLEKKVADVVEPDKDIVTSIISNVTVGVTDPTDGDLGKYPNKGKITVAFAEFGKRNGKDTKKIMERIRQSVQGYPGAKIAVAQENGGPPVQKDISIEIAGDNLDTLVNTSDRLTKYINKQNIAGIEGLVPDLQADKPEIVFDVNRERANREGVSTSQINQALGATIFGFKAADFRNTKEDNYEIDVRSQEDQRNNIDAIRNLKITYRDIATGGTIRQVPISAFTDIRYTNTYANINHKQQRRIITLGSNVLKTSNVNEVNAAIQQAIDNFKTPDGVSVRMGGGQEDQQEAATFLGTALLISFGLILIILVAQFNSVGKTFIILTEIFFSIIGVFLGVAIFKMTISIVMTGVGIIALAGVVVRNGILLVEFTDMLIEQGGSLHDAVVEAARTRMTPVLLTATAAILGLIPLAVGFNIDFGGLFSSFKPHIYFGGDNVAFWGPLSWTMIFGLGFATVITLILVPCMYIIRVRIKTSLFRSKETVEIPELEESTVA